MMQPFCKCVYVNYIDVLLGTVLKHVHCVQSSTKDDYESSGMFIDSHTDVGHGR